MDELDWQEALADDPDYLGGDWEVDYQQQERDRDYWIREEGDE
jgi:hypothetical protein